MPNRKPYPSDVSDQEWAFVAPYLALVPEDAPQRNHDLREVQKRVALGGEDRLSVALHATRLAAVGSCLSADKKMARGGPLRGDGP
jgi:transposase